jgi:hypothetical protein
MAGQRVWPLLVAVASACALQSEPALAGDRSAEGSVVARGTTPAEVRVPKRLSLRAEASLTYSQEVQEEDGQTKRIFFPLPFPSLVASWNWSPVSLEVGLGAYPGFNWMAGARVRPAIWRGHAIYLGTQALFSAPVFVWYQSLEGGYELATDVGFTVLAGAGIYMHVVEDWGGAGGFDALVTPMGRFGIGWAFIDP